MEKLKSLRSPLLIKSGKFDKNTYNIFSCQKTLESTEDMRR